MIHVNKSINKIDSLELLKGKPLYTEDLCDNNVLIVKAIRSKYAYAKIKNIDTSLALKVPGIEAIFTHKDVLKEKFTLAGQTYPEPSPYDGLILDEYVRYVGDEVALVVGKDEKSIDKAIKLVKIDYEVLKPLLDFEKALDNEIIVHQTPVKSLDNIGFDQSRNLCASGLQEINNVEDGFAKSDIVLERTYYTKANAQTPMETMRSFCKIDAANRLEITTSTQIPFHVRRIVANALGINQSQINVIKPKVGGGFGAKQSACTEIFVAFVTYKLKKACKMVYTRTEMFSATNSRHQMRVSVKIGANNDGQINAIELHTLSNTGAYGEHGPTTVGLTGHKSLPLYNKVKAVKFSYDVVYTNTMRAGAFRGYGATQGQFALETMINELANKLKMCPIKLRKINMLEENETMPMYYNELLLSCNLDKCINHVKEKIGWDYKSNRIESKDKIRSLGFAMSMQGSGISMVDVGSATLSLEDGGFISLAIGATDMGTGCDTILAQIAAESLGCDLSKIVVNAVNTDSSPYDSGSYASSTTYVTGEAVKSASQKLINCIIIETASILGEMPENLVIENMVVKSKNTTNKMSFKELYDCFAAGKCNNLLVASATNTSKVSPPPFMASAVEIEVDKLTGKVDVLNFVSSIDCGTTINPNLAKVQAEGGIVQGIGMALYEDINYNESGKMINSNFMTYTIPSRMDINNIHIDFQSSYEPTGPYGAKSIGEVVINTSAPAICEAIANATGTYIRDLPITSEKVLLSIDKQKSSF